MGYFITLWILILWIVLDPGVLARIVQPYQVANPRFRQYRDPKVEGFVGEDVRLSCGAKGHPKPYVHWYRGNQLLSLKDLNPRITAKRYTLHIKKLQVEDQGEWACKVWNQNGQLWRNFTVTIIDRLRHHVKQQLHKCPQGGLPCHIIPFQEGENGTQHEEILRKYVVGYAESEEERDETPSGVHLLNNGTVLDRPIGDDPDRSAKMFTDLPSAQYEQKRRLNPDAAIQEWNREDWQEYLDESKYERAPYFAKKHTEMKPNVLSPAGNPVTLNCKAYGEPEPLVTWFKNGLRIRNGDNRGISSKYVIKKWQLTLPEAVTSDNGKYMCEVANKLGKITFNFTVKIVERMATAPILHPGLPENKTVTVGSNVTFECRFLSDLHPHLEWYRHYTVNGSDTDEDGNPYTYLLSPGVDNTYFLEPGLILIENVTYEHEGWYTCLAGNSIGHDYNSAYLTVVSEGSDANIAAASSSVIQSVVLYGVLILLGILVLLCLLLAAARYRDRQKLRWRIEVETQGLNYVHPVKKIVSITRAESGASWAPLVTITPASSTRSRQSSQLTMLSEYEIPVDEKWEIDRQRIHLKRCIGEGAFGQVMKGELACPNGGFSTMVAVKMLKGSPKDVELMDLIREMELMKALGKHPNVINLIGSCTQNGPLYVVVELCENGNLRDYLRAHRLPDSAESELCQLPTSSSGYEEPNGLKNLRLNQTRNALTQRDLVNFAYQIARGMLYLESKQFIHRDLAARNILVTKDMVMKIADFGLARDVHYMDYYKKKTEGKLPFKWMAPEALFDRTYTTKSDVWSYGIVLWEVWTMGGTPYPALPMERFWQFLKDGYRNDRPHDCMEPIWIMMLQCWEYDPRARPTFSQLVDDLDYILTESVSEEYTPTLDETHSAEFSYRAERHDPDMKSQSEEPGSRSSRDLSSECSSGLLHAAASDPGIVPSLLLPDLADCSDHCPVERTVSETPSAQRTFNSCQQRPHSGVFALELSEEELKIGEKSSSSISVDDESSLGSPGSEEDQFRQNFDSQRPLLHRARDKENNTSDNATAVSNDYSKLPLSRAAFARKHRSLPPAPKAPTSAKTWLLQDSLGSDGNEPFTSSSGDSRSGSGASNHLSAQPSLLPYQKECVSSKESVV